VKKLFIIIPSIFTIFLFIVLNYLLWDRANKIEQDSSKDSTIAALGREIQNMETTDNILRDRVTKLDTDNKSKDDKISDLNNNLKEQQDNLSQKNELIDHIKSSSDLTDAVEVIRNWADNMSKGQYENAYQLQTPTAFGQQQTQDDFVKLCKSKITGFKVVSEKPVLQPATEDKKGDVVFKITVTVTRTADSSKFVFQEGNNDRLLTVIYNKEKNSWLISKIE
jgi:hypothetical protein